MPSSFQVSEKNKKNKLTYLGFGMFTSNSGGNVESPRYFFCFRIFFIFELNNSSYKILK